MFSKLIWDPAILLKVFIRHRSLRVGFCVSLLYTNILSATSESLTSFQFVSLLSCCYFITLARNSSTIFSRYEENRQSSIVPDFNRIVCFSPH